jgi:hypothetical protein
MSQCSHGVWIRPYEKCVSFDSSFSILSHFLLAATVPTPEQTYETLAPDLKKQVDATRATRLARENVTAEQFKTQASVP